MAPPNDDATTTLRIDLVSPTPSAGEPPASKGAEGVAGTDTTSVVGPPRPVRSPDYQKLRESIYDAVLVTDPKGRIVDFNDRALDFFLYGEPELLGKRVVELISGADASLLAAIHRNLQNHRYTLIEARCRRRDRTLFPAEIAVNRIDLDDRCCLCFLVRDISVRKKAQQALEEAVARLEAHDRAQSQFVTNVSHELRTPLTSMIYAVNNLLRGVCGPLSDRVRRYLEMLDGDARRLLSTVNDILDLRKIESQSLPLHRAPISLLWLVRESLDGIRLQAEHKKHTLRLLDDHRNLFVLVDPPKLERVFLNVIGNAVKFTPPGGEIVIRLEPDPQSPNAACVEVVDNGIGIPPAALDKVTQRFFTVGPQATGTGLGLAIAKEIVELHGGTLRLKSPPPGRERGTAVRVTLPLTEGARVLVFGAEAELRDLMMRQLGQNGFRVVCQEGLADAMALACAGRVDAALVDLDGSRAAASALMFGLSQHEATLRLPLVAIAGEALSPAQEELLGSLGVSLLQKPWKEQDLLDRLNRAIMRRCQREDLPVLRHFAERKATDRACTGIAKQV